MKEFTVHFHEEDGVGTMTVNKLNEADYQVVTAGGTRHLFELDTNIGFFVYFDAKSADGKESYLILQYEEDQEEPEACYSFELKDFYQFVALHLNDLEFDEEENEEEEEVFSPIHFLAHLMHHIVEAGNEVEA